MSIPYVLYQKEKTRYVVAAYFFLSSFIIYASYFKEFDAVFQGEADLDSILPFLAIGSFLMAIMIFMRPHLYLNNYILARFDGRDAKTTKSASLKRASRTPLASNQKDQFWGTAIFLASLCGTYWVFYFNEPSKIHFLWLGSNRRDFEILDTNWDLADLPFGTNADLALLALLLAAIFLMAYGASGCRWNYWLRLKLVREYLETHDNDLLEALQEDLWTKNDEYKKIADYSKSRMPSNLKAAFAIFVISGIIIPFLGNLVPCLENLLF